MTNYYQSFIDEVSLVARKFLLERGGLGNGYNTYVKGCVQVGSHLSLEWSTPTRDDLTGRQVRKLGTELYSSIVSVMRKFGVSRCEFRAECEEHGCYRITVHVCECGRVSLW